MKMNVVLVSIGNFQDYILENIRNLIFLNHRNIFVITNEKFQNQFDEFKENPALNLVFVENLTDIFHFYEKTTLDKEFRDGFWTFTSLRFFYIFAMMKEFNLKNVIHIENDVLLYYNSDELLENIDDTKIYIPFNSFNVNVASIVYIPNAELFGHLLQHYDMRYFDMRIFAYWKQMFPHLIEAFPIIKFESEGGESNMVNHFSLKFIKPKPDIIPEPLKTLVSSNFSKFNKIFDGNAMGQYLGGIDNRNVENGESTVGFVNAECVVKYNEYTFIWKEMGGSEDGCNKKPFLVLKNGEEIPIFNLHIHCKDLEKFARGRGF